MNIQWFPGHMSKTLRILKEDLKLIDIIIELVDARIPYSSKNPEIVKLLGRKPMILALNKSDLANKNILTKWTKWYEENNQVYVLINSLNGSGFNIMKKKIMELMEPKFATDKLKGRKFRPVRTMVVGIPNVGKSSFINRVSGKASTKTGDRPGITKSKQWIRLNNEIEMLDTPGVLWPKFENEEVGLNLAFTGAIKDEIMDIETLAMKLLQRLGKVDPLAINERFGVSVDNVEDYKILEDIGKKRGCLLAKGEVDYNRISRIILDEFRSGKMGKITLEIPDNTTDNTPDDTTDNTPDTKER